MLYHYKYQASKDGFTLQVFEPGTSIFVYNASYPSYSECNFSGELVEDETPLTLGVMKSLSDCEGLTKFLIGNKILQPGDTIEPGVPGMKPAKSIELIASEKGVDIPYAEQQLQAGMKVESEHSTDPEIQKTIALQHLDENIDYYKALDKMENKFSEGGTTSSTPLKDAYQKRISGLDNSKQFTDVKELAVGDYVAIEGDHNNTYYGFVKKIGRKNITIESAYGGYADNDYISIQELQFSLDKVKGFYKPGKSASAFTSGERDINEYMDEMRKKHGMNEAWYQFIKSYMVKHNQNVDVDMLMEMAHKIADHDKDEFNLAHVAEALQYDVNKSKNDPLYGRISIFDVESFVEYGRWQDGNLDRMKELGILPRMGEIDLAAAERLKKEWKKTFGQYDKYEDGAKRLIKNYVRFNLLPVAEEKEGQTGLNAIYKLTTLLKKINSKPARKKSLLDVVASVISETNDKDKPEEAMLPQKGEKQLEISKSEQPKEKYRDLKKAFKDLYNVDPIELWKKTMEFYKDGYGFVNEVGKSYEILGGEKSKETHLISDDLVICLMTDPLLEEMKLKKSDLIDPSNEHSFYGVLNIHKINRNIAPEKQILNIFKGIVSTDDLRPALTGVYHDVTAQRLVATNAHIVAVMPYKLTGENRIIDIKTGKPVQGKDSYNETPKFPDYNVVIPQGKYVNPIRVKNVQIKTWWSKLNGMVKAMKLCDRENSISCCVATEYQVQYFDPEYMLALVSFFLKSGVSEVDLEISEKNTRGMVLRASNMKDMLALIMPLYNESGDVPSVLYDYLDVPGATTTGDVTPLQKHEERVPLGDQVSSIEEDTALAPEIIADEVAREAIDADKNAKLLPPEQKSMVHQMLAGALVSKTHTIYLNNEGFKKKVNASGNKGRDHLYMFMKHWAEGLLKEYKIQPPSTPTLALKPEEKVEPAKEQSAHEKYFGEATETALTKQFVSIKEKYPDAILLFKVGDYYESFSTDAKFVSDTISCTLTHAKGYDMTGFASNMIDEYLPKLVKAGKQVALVEDGVEGKEKQMVKRKTLKEAAKEFFSDDPEIKKLQVEKMKLQGKAFKHMPASPNQKKVKEQIDELNNRIEKLKTEPKKSSTPAPEKKEEHQAPEKKERSERAIKQDKGIKALHPGKRTSADGNVYYESRDNRSDDDRRKKFAKGGQVDQKKEAIIMTFYNVAGIPASVTMFDNGDISVEPTQYAKKYGSKLDGMQIIYDHEEKIYEVSEFQAGAKQDELWIYKETPSLKIAIKDLLKGNNRKPIKKWDNDTSHKGAKVSGVHFAQGGEVKKKSRLRKALPLLLLLKKGGSLSSASKDYNYFVVNKGNKILAGYEYREDAGDFIKEAEMAGAKIYTPQFIKSKLGYDPYDYTNWESLT